MKHLEKDDKAENELNLWMNLDNNYLSSHGDDAKKVRVLSVR